MGYELTIKREDENRKISKSEWTEYIKSDSNFELIQEFSAIFNENESLTIPTPNAGLWITDKGDIPFTFNEERGEITVKSPDDWIIEKMISISTLLDSIVIGEEDELYNKDYLKDPFYYHSNNASSTTTKKWWQFWK